MLRRIASFFEELQVFLIFRRMFWLVACAVCVLACYWSIRFAIADSLYRENTLDSLQRAVRLASGNASSHALLAEHLEGLGMDPGPELSTAVRLSPYDASIWIRLGFRAEVEGNYAKAEEYLLHAASVNRKFDPRWALMNYYFRRGDTEKFWYWAEKSLEISYGDVTPVFRLMWNVSDDGKVILGHLPPGNQLLVRYFEFLKDNGHLDAAGLIAETVASRLEPSDLGVMLNYFDRTMSTGSSSILPAWNALCRRRLLPFDQLDPDKGLIVTDGGFTLNPTGTGFEWRQPPQEGVFLEPVGDAGGLIIRMSGAESEDCVILEQVMPVRAGRRYTLRYGYQALETSVVSGLFWELSGAGPAAGDLVRSIRLTPETRLKGDSLTFQADNYYIRVKLRYQRPLGSTRAAGSVLMPRLEGSGSQ